MAYLASLSPRYTSADVLFQGRLRRYAELLWDVHRYLPWRALLCELRPLLDTWRSWKFFRELHEVHTHRRWLGRASQSMASIHHRREVRAPETHPNEAAISLGHAMFYKELTRSSVPDLTQKPVKSDLIPRSVITLSHSVKSYERTPLLTLIPRFKSCPVIGPSFFQMVCPLHWRRTNKRVESNATYLAEATVRSHWQLSLHSSSVSLWRF